MKSHDVAEASSSKELSNTLRKMSSRKKIRKRSLEEKSFFSVASTFFKNFYYTIMKSKLPTYLCISIYIIICLLGNIATLIIWLKHHPFFDTVEENIDTFENDTTLDFAGN